MGVGRLIALLALAVEDLVAHSPVPQRRIPLLLDASPLEERPGLQEQLAQESTEGEVGDLAMGLATGLARATASTGLSWELQLTQKGHAGVLEALQTAGELLRSGQRDLCIIGGVDSYMDPLTQEWLYGTQQLKHPNRAVGLMPGEGAAVLLIERASTAQRRGAEILAKAGPISIQEEDYWFSDDELFPHGRALARVIAEVMKGVSHRAPSIGVIFNDLNGQAVRAMEWGNVLTRLSSEHTGLRNTQCWMPAMSFGDVGSASGAFSLCMATRAFARGYAGGPKILLCNSSERGLRGAAILRHPNQQEE